MVINKGIFRGFAKELLRYAAVILLIIIGMGFVMGGAVGNASIVRVVEDNQKKAVLEDGEFTLYQAMDDSLKSKLEDQYGLEIQKQWYVDADSEKDSTLRLFQIRKSIDKITVIEGDLPDAENEILIEKNYASEHKLEIGDNVTLNGASYKITGIGTTPDYCYVKQNVADFNANPNKFGTAFTTEQGFERISTAAEEKNKLMYQYSFLNPDDEKNSDIISTISDDAILTSFVDADNNSRIDAYEDDCGMMYKATLIFGVIYFILIGYVLSIFTVNKIEAERKQIGTLTSLGYRKMEILRHYMILPVLIGFIASIIGTVFGINCMADMMAGDSIALYSFPDVTYSCSGLLIAYSLLMPIVVIIISNSLAVNKKLKLRPLEMLHNIPKNVKNKKAKKEIASMMGVFRKRQRSAEIRSNVILVIGVMISAVLMILGFSTGGSMDKYIDHIDEATDYQYIYYMNNDQAEIPGDAESVLARKVNYVKEDDTTMDVNLMGLDKDSQYFHDDIDTGEDEIVVSSAAAEKFGIEKGDTVTLNDVLKSKDYQFKVQKIVNEEKGLYFFMDKSSMKSRLDLNSNYNMVFSDQELSFEESQVSSIEEKSDIMESAQQMKDNLNMMVMIMKFCGLMVFLIVVYLLISMMISRSSYDISLMKIMGYNTKELVRSYLGSSYVTVFWSCLISIPVGKIITKAVFPYFVSDTAANITPYMNPQDYAMLLAYMLVCCFIILLLLTRKISRTSMVEVLKDKE